MRLFIANISKAHHDFMYWLGERNKPITHPIRAGSQEMLPQDLNRDDIDNIIAQHQRYGMIPATEAGKRKEFAGLCYSVDKPVDVERIRRGIESAEDAAGLRSHEMAKQQTAAVMDRLAQGEGGTVNAVDLEVTELQRSLAPGETRTEAPIDRTVSAERTGKPRKGRARNAH